MFLTNRFWYLPVALFCFGLFFPIGLAADSLIAAADDQALGKVRWRMVPGVNAGYNQLLSGYDDYSNLGNVGLDLYFKAARPVNRTARFTDHLIYRLSIDYFPLQVPEEINGVTEDIYAVSINMLYRFQDLRYRERDIGWIPFVGFGFGYYLDRLTLDTPASGKKTGTHTMVGGSVSLGAFSPLVFGDTIRLAPEIRLHALKAPDMWATNMTYQVAATLWLGPPNE
jgi:hypothetical protein